MSKEIIIIQRERDDMEGSLNTNIAIFFRMMRDSNIPQTKSFLVDMAKSLKIMAHSFLSIEITAAAA